MKRNPHDPRPLGIQEVSLSFKKDDAKIQALNLQVEEIDIEELLWHFDYPFWEKEGTDDWNLTPWELIRNPQNEPTHYKRVQAVDLSYPLQIMRHKGRWLLLDGLHRLVKAYLEGRKTVRIREVPKSAIPLIKTEGWGNI